MKNFNKIINIILISLAVTIGVAFIVLYIIDKTNATSTLDYIVEILNKPLPIIGITTGCEKGLYKVSPYDYNQYATSEWHASL